MAAASNNRTMSSLFRFAFKYRQNYVSTSAASQAGVSLRTAETFRSLHTPSIIRQESCDNGPKSESERRNLAFQTLRRLGVRFSIEDYEAFVENTIKKLHLSDEGRARIMSAFKFLKEEGLSIEEGMYTFHLCDLIEHKMVEEFKFLVKTIKEEIPGSTSELGYYEMLLWIKLKDEEKIEEIGRRIIDRWDRLSSLEVNYLEAFCVTYQCEYLETLLKTVDITKASSLDQLTTIFKYLGRMELVFDAEMLLEELKGSAWAEDISHLIFSYAASMQYSEDNVTETCGSLHTKLDVKPSFELFDKLITFEFDSPDYSKVPLAAKIIDDMRQNGLIENSEEERYFYDTIESIYGVDWLRTTEDVIKDMGSTKFQLNKFIGKFSDNMLKSGRI